ncbi:MAG: FkbM family methyltransferase [Pseudomonadota bacterium]
MNDKPVEENRVNKAIRELGIDHKEAKRANAMLTELLMKRKAERKKDYSLEERTLGNFFSYALPRVKDAQGQLFQDLWVLWELGGDHHGGFFVEFGATNGITMSNSHILEKKYGWNGIVAEPNPEYHERLGRERDCQISHKCVYSTTGQTFKFLCAEKGLMSRLSHINPEDHNEQNGKRIVKEEIDVETISLEDLLTEYNAPDEIEYMSVDTEGSELEILKAFDFSKRNVKMLTVEHNFTPLRQEIYDLLSANGYKRRFPEYTRFDDWYIHESLDQ